MLSESLKKHSQFNNLAGKGVVEEYISLFYQKVLDIVLQFLDPFPSHLKPYPE